MKLNMRAVATLCALVGGGLAMLGTSLANIIWPTYGDKFRQVMESLHSAYRAPSILGMVLVGVVYGLRGGGVGGALAAWLYNLSAG